MEQVAIAVSPLPFGVLPFGHIKMTADETEYGQTVSIAFRRSALRPRRAATSPARRRPSSPLPFGVLPFGHERRRGAHQRCPAVSIAFRRSALRPPVQRRTDLSSAIHVSIAFRRSALRPQRYWHRPTRWRSWSPLPFGVLPFGHPLVDGLRLWNQGLSPLPFGVLPFGHVRPSFIYFAATTESPLPFGVLPFGHGRGREGARGREGVSIAFRRSALRPRVARLTGFTPRLRSPLPFGVLPFGHRRRGSCYTTSSPCLHCLSAFCPSATRSYILEAMEPLMSPLPFGVLPFGHRWQWP